MQFDNNALRKITNMNDRELRDTISAIAREKGLSLPNISESDLLRIRSALAKMTPAELSRLAEAFKSKGADR